LRTWTATFAFPVFYSELLNKKPLIRIFGKNAKSFLAVSYEM